MKPAPFAYHAPQSVADAVSLLAEHGADAKVLAGGQSLVPAMSLRLARPRVLIDVNRIAAMGGISTESSKVRIGAMVRHAHLEHGSAPGSLGVLLAAVAGNIGHPPIRVRGTIGGSLAFAHPSAEWNLVAVALDAEITVKSSRGTRFLDAASFFAGGFTTEAAPDELITDVLLPQISRAARFSFLESSPRSRDFATASALVVLEFDGEQITDSRIGFGAVCDRPVRAVTAETALRGQRASAGLFAEIAEEATRELVARTDVHACAEYRRALATTLCRRALSIAGKGGLR